MNANHYFSVTAEEILNGTKIDEIEVQFDKSENGVHVSFDYIDYDGLMENECNVYVLCDLGYVYTKTFEGDKCLEKAVKFANSKLNDKYLSQN